MNLGKDVCVVGGDSSKEFSVVLNNCAIFNGQKMTYTCGSVFVSTIVRYCVRQTINFDAFFYHMHKINLLFVLILSDVLKGTDKFTFDNIKNEVHHLTYNEWRICLFHTY